jgi:hypothetical protein
MASTPDQKDIFDSKYTEFCNDLEGACPEFVTGISAARALSTEERKSQFRKDVLSSCSPTRDSSKAPMYVLPGVQMTEDVWVLLSENSKRAIQEYLTLLSFCVLMEDGPAPDMSGEAGWTESWAKKMMEDMKEKMKGVDFSGLSEKFAKFFGSAAGSFGAGGLGGLGGIPQIPEKFMKGQIAKLAEEIVKEFRIEDFGLDPEQMKAAENDPTKALNMIMEVFMKNPQAFQNTIAKLTKKLQQKIQNGSLRPQELVAEAEELMKTFSENPQFVEMMEGFRSAFSMDGHEDEARAAGRDGSARLSIVQQRLRKKLEKRKGGKK